MKYFCEHCNYQAKQKSHYDKHLKTNKHNLRCNSEHFKTKSEHLGGNVEQNMNMLSPKSDKYPCKYCQKTFTTKTSMYRHIRNSCKKSEEEDMNDFAQLFNSWMKKHMKTENFKNEFLMAMNDNNLKISEISK